MTGIGNYGPMLKVWIVDMKVLEAWLWWRHVARCEVRVGVGGGGLLVGLLGAL